MFGCRCGSPKGWLLVRSVAGDCAGFLYAIVRSHPDFTDSLNSLDSSLDVCNAWLHISHCFSPLLVYLRRAEHLTCPSSSGFVCSLHLEQISRKFPAGPLPAHYSAATTRAIVSSLAVSTTGRSTRTQLRRTHASIELARPGHIY
jgi:hypothetical protein